MNATKRKFNALLNGFGNKSTSSTPANTITSSQDATSGEIQKRRRIIDENGALTLSPSSDSRPSATRSIALQHKKSASLATATFNQETPKYAPWDRAEFLKRLKSFSNLTDWTPKPARVNEVEWAKRGWVCQRSERVRCCLCNVEIMVKLNRKEINGKEEAVYIAQNIEDALVDKYADLIVTSHDANCLWRKRGCDESIFKLPLSNAEITFHNLRQRYDELLTRRENLPYMFNMRTPPNFELANMLKYLPKDFFVISHANTLTEQTLNGDINRVALLMALFGWQSHSHERLGNQVGSVSCHACFRVLGLWLFKSKEVNDAGEEVVRAAVNCLDVVDEHREYCPWRNPFSQNGQNKPASLPGWAVMMRVVKSDYFLRINGERQPGIISTPRSMRSEANPFDAEAGDAEDAESIRDDADRKRWARLRRVKSLFDTKGGKKLSPPDKTKSKVST